jgi:iron(III) transport system ATP-binding protein
MPAHRRNIGYMAQEGALFPHMTVLQNVTFALGRGRRREAFELLELVGIDRGMAARRPHELSGGQQQRVALARALATSPGLLLLDEPLSALDARVRVRLRQEIKDLQRRVGVTTIMVTHDQEEALTMADRIVVMNRGEIEQIGSPTEIYRDPASAFVADFIGAMTFMAAEALDATHVRVGPMVLETAPYSIMRGSGVSVGIRPEEVRVRNLGADATNRMDTRIDALEFLGAFARARLVPDAAPQMHVLADFSVNAMRDLSAKGPAAGPIWLTRSRNVPSYCRGMSTPNLPSWKALYSRPKRARAAARRCGACRSARGRRSRHGTARAR